MKTQMVRLVALGRGRQTYGTRVLTAGEEFEMRRDYADLLIRIGKARLAGGPPDHPEDQPAKIEEPAAAQDLPERVPDETMSTRPDIDTLRDQAARLGISVDGRWGVARLQHEIARAKR